MQANLIPKGARKRKQMKPKDSRRREIIKIRTEKSDIETTKPKTQEKKKKINETRSWFLININETDKPLARLLKKEKRKDSNKITNERGEVTADTTEIQITIREHYKNICP